LRSIWSDSVFFETLRAVDRGKAEEERAKGCPHCGGILDTANFPRKPRGVGGTTHPVQRFSFCCRREGCRKRTTPESVRFLGRKIYVGVVVTLAVFEPVVSERLNLCRQTLSRWSAYWVGVFGFASHFWRERRAMFPPGFDAAGSPAAVVRFFEERGSTAEEAAKSWLTFFSTLSLSHLA